MQDDAELRARIAAQVAARRAAASAQTDDAAAEGSDAQLRPRPSSVIDPRTLSPTRSWPAREPGGAGDPAVSGPTVSDEPAVLEPARPWIDRAPNAGNESAGPAPSNPAAVLSTLADGLVTESESGQSGAERLEERRRFAQRHAAADAALAAGMLPGESSPEQSAAVTDADPHRRHRWRRGRPMDPASAVDPTAPRNAEVSPPVIDEPPVIPGAEPEAPGDAALAAEPETDAEPEAEYPWLKRDEVDLDLKGAPTWDPADYPAEPESDGRRAGRAFKWLFARAEPTAAPTEPTADVPKDTSPPETPVAEAPVAEAPVAAPPVGAPPPAPEVSLNGAASVVEDAVELEAADETKAQPEAEPSSDSAVESAAPAAAPSADPPDPIELARDQLRRRSSVDTSRDDVPTKESPAAEPAGEGTKPPAGRRRGLGGRLRRRARDDADEVIEPFTLPEEDASFTKPWSVTLRRPEPEPAAEPGPAAVDDEAEPAVPPPPPEPAEPLAPPQLVKLPEPPEAPAPPAPAQPVETPALPAASQLADLPITDWLPVTDWLPSPGTTSTPAPDAEDDDSARPRPRPRPSPGPDDADDPATPATPSWPPPLEPPAPLPPRLGIAGAEGGDAPAWLGGGGISGVSFAKPGSSSKATPSPDLTRFLAASDAQPGEAGPTLVVQDEPPRSWRKWRGWRFVIRSTIVLAIAAVAALLLRAYVVAPYYIPSASMYPTLHGCPGCTDDHILVDKISYRTHDPKEDDIVVFNRPSRWKVPDDVVVKRVIGVPGDKLELKKGQVLVNGLLLDETYVNQNCKGGTKPLTGKTTWTVPDNDVFVMGDNRCNSEDSRMFGPIPQSSIIGRAFMIIWPLNRIRFL